MEKLTDFSTTIKIEESLSNVNMWMVVEKV
jgi:hypothetical protein